MIFSQTFFDWFIIVNINWLFFHRCDRTAFFHFTKTFDAFSGIINNGFYPHYCIEKFLGGLDKIADYMSEHLDAKEIEGLGIRNDFGIPMVSFCDIRLSQTKKHLSEYGHYAIGLNKEWKDKTEISPIIYLDTKNSATNHIINTLFGSLLLLYGPEETKIAIQELLEQLLNLACFVKPYEGRKWNKKNKKYEKTLVNFYGEREWRYVPPIYIQKKLGVEDLPPQILPEKYLYDENNNNIFNELLKVKFNLRFEAEDVKYLIVNNNMDLNRAVELIESHDGFKKNQKNILLTKLLTVSQIMEDF